MPRSPLLVLLALLLGPAAPLRAQEPAPAPDDAPPIVVPFLVDGFRAPLVTPAQVLVASPREREALRVERVSLVAGGHVLAAEELGLDLAPDPRYVRAGEIVERLPVDLTELHRPRAFAAPDAPTYEGEEALDRLRELDGLVTGLRADLAAGAPAPFVAVDLALPLDQVFADDDPVGAERVVVARAEWRRPDGSLAVTEAARTVRRLAPWRGAPPALAARGVTVHRGDMHVHSCHGESLGACPPSTDCKAESLQTSGSFTYAQLRAQYQALGLDWFTATDHSYCIDSDAEYAAVVAECAALTDASFVCAPDTELSSDEEGPQEGSDLGDLVCLGTTQASHMGAHAIEARKPGGDGSFLGFCDGFFQDVLEPFSLNAAAIRAEGGYPVVNHPAGTSFGWNSHDATHGIEAWSMHGVEIWNGPTPSGQGGHVAEWVEWLLEGRILYAYAGSDTHDAAFDFGANHAVFEDVPFTPEGLEQVLEAGRVFVSNGHALVLEAVLEGLVIPMGTLQSLPPGTPPLPLELRAHYDFGTDTASITLFRGRVGDPAESVLCTSGPLTGAGTFTCTDVLLPGARTWVRAYSEAGALVAYTNPVFLLPSTCSLVPFGVGLGGANVATLASDSAPTLGTRARLELSGFSPLSPTAFVAFSETALPGGLPILGGTLLVAPPFLHQAAVPLSAGAGELVLDLPLDPVFAGAALHAQSAALDPTLPQGLAFSNGLSFTLCGLLQ